MSYSDLFADLEDIPSSKPYTNPFTSYYDNLLDFVYEISEPKPETLENDIEVELPYYSNSISTSDQADTVVDQNEVDFILPASVQPQEPSEDDKLTISQTNTTKPEKRKRKRKSSKAKEYSDDSDEEIVTPKKVKKTKAISITFTIPNEIIVRGIAAYGETKKCFKCNQTYDKNHMFIYSEDKTTNVDDKPYICLVCSISVNDDKMLRDWDLGLENSFKCYRCNHNRSAGRRNKNSSYCYYCALKKKRAYHIRQIYGV